MIHPQFPHGLSVEDLRSTPLALLQKFLNS